jgi:hypothetical protein
MPSRRAAIAMTEPELHRFLGEERLVTVASIGPNGRPHLMPLYYVADGAVISMWTFAKSQKVKNLERLPQATLQVEAGEHYHELRGAMLECDVEIIRDTATVATIGARIAGVPAGEIPDHVREQAPKRVGLVFRPTRVASFDHRKLGSGS